MKFNTINESYKCVKIGGILRNLNNDETKLYNLIKSKGRLFKLEMPEYDQQMASSMVSKGLLRKRRLKDPNSKYNGYIYYTTLGRSGQLKGNSLEEVAPPGKESESWIRKNKKRFKERYGKDYEKYLYGKAWNNYNGRKKVSESIEYDVEVLTEDITAYHGSPNDFDQFDTKFMGEGQGAQAHGWGLYFALDPKTSKENYQKVYGSKNGLISFKFNDKTYQKPKLMYYVLNDIYEGHLDKAIERLENYLTDEEFVSNHPNAKEKISNQIELIKKIDPTKIKKNVSLQVGQFYTVKLPDVVNYLAEESPFLSQPIKIQKKIMRVYKALKLNITHLTQRNIDGERIYDEIKDELGGSKRRASLKLLEYGVKGIYYNGYSDGWCVVIFDHNDIKIVNKENNYSPDEESLPANIMDILMDDPSQVENYDNLPTEVQVAVFNKNHNLIDKIKNPTDKFIDYIYNEFLNGNFTKEDKPKIILAIFDKLDDKQKNTLFNDDTIFLLTCAEKLSESEIKKYAKLYTDDIIKIKELTALLYNSSKILINQFSEKLFAQIFQNLYSKNLWTSVTEIEAYRNFMGKFYKNDMYESETKFVKLPYFEDLYTYLWPSGIDYNLTVHNCEIVERVFKDAAENDLPESAIGKCGRFTDSDTKKAEPAACEYVLKWSKDHPSFVNDIIKSEEFVAFCGMDRMLKYSDTPETLYTLANAIKYEPKKYINFYNLIYTEKYKQLRNSKPLDVDEQDIFYAFIHPTIGIFDDLDKNAQINLAKVTPYYLHEISKQQLIKIWSTYCDYDMQKQILLKDVSYLRLVPKVDKKIQQAMIEKNPYFIKYIIKPDKQVVKHLIDTYGDTIKDYIRGM